MTFEQRKDGKYQTLEYIKVENEYYIVKYANYADWYNVIILLMKDNWLLAISYKIFLWKYFTNAWRNVILQAERTVIKKQIMRRT